MFWKLKGKSVCFFSAQISESWEPECPISLIPHLRKNNYQSPNFFATSPYNICIFFRKHDKEAYTKENLGTQGSSCNCERPRNQRTHSIQRIITNLQIFQLNQNPTNLAALKKETLVWLKTTHQPPQHPQLRLPHRQLAAAATNAPSHGTGFDECTTWQPSKQLVEGSSRTMDQEYMHFHHNKHQFTKQFSSNLQSNK